MQLDSKTWLSLLGPVALGAVLGQGAGVAAMAQRSLLLPCLVLGLSLALAPALYIGLSLVGAAPPARAGASELLRSLESAGLVMAGLAPAVSFLSVSAGAGTANYALGMFVVGGAALIGLRQLFRGLVQITPNPQRLALVFMPWGLIAVLLGSDLLASLIRKGGLA